MKLKNILYAVLTESPDRVNSEIPGYRKYNLTYNDPDALPFAWVENECVIGEFKHYHHQMPNLPTYVAAAVEPREVMDYPGRLWKDDKVISFWACPSPSNMKKRIAELNDELAHFSHTRGIKIDVKQWNLDVKALSPYGGLVNKLIKIDDYINKTFNYEFIIPAWNENAEHIYSKTFNPKKIIKIENQILESPDTVYIPKEYLNLSYHNIADKPYPFAYDKEQKIWKIGELAKGHNQLDIEYDNRKFEGRVFLVNRIITFWVFPGITKFKNLLVELKKQKKIKVDLNWRLEVYSENESPMLISLKNLFSKNFDNPIALDYANRLSPNYFPKNIKK